MEVHADEVIRNAAAHAYCHLAVSCRIPGKPGTRLQVFPFALHFGVAVEAGIDGITEARRSAGSDLALNAFVEILQRERVNVAVAELHWHERRPAKSIVQRQLSRSLPGVLQIKGEIVLRQVFRIRVRLVKLRYPAR